MTRRVKLWIGCGAAVAMLALAGLLVLRSDWFSRIVRDRIAFEAGRATGGRVEIGSFRFDWRRLRVELGELVIHGSEPSSGPPLLRVASVSFTLKPVPLLNGTVDLDDFEAIQPQAHLFIDPSGQTNVPGPAPSQRTRTLFNLAIQHFTVRDGEFDVNSSRNPWSATGANFRTVFRQQPGSRYQGSFSIEPLELRLSQDLPITLHVKSTFTVAKNQIAFSSATLDSAESHAELSGTIQNLASPRCDFQYKVQLSLGEASRVLKVRAPQSGVIAVEGAGHFAGAADYIATGHLHASNLSFGEGARAVQSVTADSAVRIDPLKIELTGLRMEALGGALTGQGEVTALDRFRINGEVVGLNLARLVSQYGSRPAPWNGVVAGSIEAHGLLSQLYLRR